MLGGSLSQHPWLPVSLLPSRPSTLRGGTLEGADDATRIVAWRLHIRDIAADGLPSGSSVGHSEWNGLFLRFTVTWSHESKRTSATHAAGEHSWNGEHAVLALPNATTNEVPESEVDVAVCARIAGRPDEVISAARVLIGASTGQRHIALQSRAVAGIRVTVSFGFDVTGITRAEAEGEWSEPALLSEEPAASHARSVHSSSTITVLSPHPSSSRPESAQPISARQRAGLAAQQPGGARSYSALPQQHARPLAKTSFAFGRAIPPPAAAPVRVVTIAPRTLSPPRALSPPKAPPKDTAAPGAMRPSADAWLRPQAAPSARLFMQLDECVPPRARARRPNPPAPGRGQLWRQSRALHDALTMRHAVNPLCTGVPASRRPSSGRGCPARPLPSRRACCCPRIGRSHTATASCPGRASFRGQWCPGPPRPKGRAKRAKRAASPSLHVAKSRSGQFVRLCTFRPAVNAYTVHRPGRYYGGGG